MKRCRKAFELLMFCLYCRLLNSLDTDLQLALKINNDSVKGAFGAIAKCYEDLNDLGNAKRIMS